MRKSKGTVPNRKLTKWLRDKRKELGYSMPTLGALLDAPHSFVGKVENQERRLDVVEYVTYCQALGVSPFEGIQIIMDCQ